LRSAATISPIWRPDSVSTAPAALASISIAERNSYDVASG
jgi:hypothetical protein